jgi:phenylpropionate dioxygenase-like ring-hydroxylating dioxygenase large terminal subunit
MDRETQIALVKRVLAHVDRKTTDTGAGPTLQPVAPYVDRARFEREIAVLFRKLPLAIAHGSTIPQPGDYFTHDASGVPLLVVRRDDGTIGAYLNVCRHRGTRVENAPCGKKAAFSCPYHAWSYGRDGRLLTVPHERTFGPVAKDTRGLVEVPAAEVAGLVWIQPSPGEPIDVASYLGPLARDLETFGVASGHVYSPVDYVRELGWKLSLDIFLESYHLKTAHHDSIYPVFFDNLGLVELHGPHQRNVFPKRSIQELRDAPEDTWLLRKHANVLYHLFPNTLVLVQPDHAAVLHLWPDGPTRTRMTAYTLVPEPPVTEKAKKYWDANNAILYGATDEDFALGASIQAGLTSDANTHLVFGAFEHGLEHFHREIARRVD